MAAAAEGEAEAQAFVGVVADEDIDIIVLPGLIQLVLVVRNDIAVSDGPAAGAAEATHDALDISRTQLLQRIIITESAFGPRRIGLLGHGEGLHVLTGIGLGVGGAEGAATLGDRPLEKTLRQRRSAQHAHGNVTLSGSPPNFAMLSFTHCRPAIWSSRP